MARDDGEAAMNSEMWETNEHRRYSAEAGVFDHLYPRVEKLLEGFGRPNFLPGQPAGDFTVHGDYSGHPQVVVFVTNLAMLRPAIVGDLQRLIKDYPSWQISMTVAMREHRDWPRMGLYIRPHEIIDGLQRQYFPKEFQDFEYEGARRGTA
jgi:hypothetical protein